MSKDQQCKHDRTNRNGNYECCLDCGATRMYLNNKPDNWHSCPRCQYGQTHTAKMLRAARHIAAELGTTPDVTVGVIRDASTAKLSPIEQHRLEQIKANRQPTIIGAALDKLNQEERARLAEQMEADTEAWDQRDQT